MNTATIEEFTARVSEFLHRVEAGEELTLSRAGRPIARLSPTTAVPTSRGAAAKPDILARLRAQYGDRSMSAEAAAAILDGVRGSA